MTEFDKIDRVLKFIINCNTPPRRTFDEIAQQINIKLSTKELIEILEKLNDDKFVIRQYDNNGIYHYFSSFEGRLFFKEGGYKSKYKSQKRKRIYAVSMTAINVTNIFAIIILTFLNYRATDKANDNKEDVLKLNSTIQHLTKSNDSLRNIILRDFTKKKH